jgi:hypothetical protein
MMTGEKKKSEKLMSGKRIDFEAKKIFAKTQSAKGFSENTSALSECGDQIVKL